MRQQRNKLAAALFYCVAYTLVVLQVWEADKGIVLASLVSSRSRNDIGTGQLCAEGLRLFFDSLWSGELEDESRSFYLALFTREERQSVDVFLAYARKEGIIVYIAG